MLHACTSRCCAANDIASMLYVLQGLMCTLSIHRDVHLRVLVDHSCVEVYTGTGEVLSTRIYRCAFSS